MTFNFNLQLFSQEKTEKATPKKRQDSRKKGQVLKSPEISSAFTLLVTFSVLRFWIPFMFERLIGLIEFVLVNLIHTEIDFTSALQLALLAIEEFAYLFAPIGIAVMAIGIIINYLQVGSLFTTDPLKMKFNRLNPIEGFKKLFSKKSLVQLVKSILKISAIGYVVYLIIRNHINNLPDIIEMDFLVALLKIGDTVLRVALLSGGVMVFIALLDYLYSWWEFEQNLKMSKQEIKDEYKQMEGDPLIRSKIKERQRMMARRRMMQDIPNADVIITNPTHFAIALKYDQNSGQAPTVIAKGQDLVAQQIKEVARENNIVLYEDVALARSLYKVVEIGEQIPFEFFKAVAEVLAFVYKVKGRAVNI
ncbi:flagellar biosynthesis protein FlhB [Alkalicella caledoniensis]|uniref:Flagellar biosynthetic protein FlhB n=1 Tax=Alkalicella caledoniensis TaxID=2731377 RepID=A0A7G9WCM1_ALKCA|nr:flagellar biosynthesis protein FlhB [Alkalicella caledoniensis]QNO16433.1 flagellar biosynthesis protein FlhB [Alkalicella caledoniensis]